MFYLRKEKCIKVTQRGGAVEACWAHNPEDGRSKLLSATFLDQIKRNSLIFNFYVENILFLLIRMKKLIYQLLIKRK